MTKKPNNNFADPRTKSKVRFRLYIIHNNKGMQAGHRRKFGYNGYVTHADKGYSQLLKILDNRKGMMVKALMYDYSISSTKPIIEWDYSKKTSRT